MTHIIIAALLIIVPVAFTVFFALLGKTFEYPAILRKPAGDVLAKFSAGGTKLIVLWWAFTMSAVAFVPIAVGVGEVLRGPLAQAAVIVGVLAALVQTLGLVRWPFLVPLLAREREKNPEMVDLLFTVANRYLGIAVGEHLGYLLTGSWTILVAIAAAPIAPLWFVIAGAVIGLALLFGSLEFLGRFEQHGWHLAGTVVAIAYTAWTAWLVIGGVLLLLA